jgi:hypothetical protein
MMSMSISHSLVRPVTRAVHGGEMITKCMIISPRGSIGHPLAETS